MCARVLTLSEILFNRRTCALTVAKPVGLDVANMLFPRSTWLWWGLCTLPSVTLTSVGCVQCIWIALASGGPNGAAECGPYSGISKEFL